MAFNRSLHPLSAEAAAQQLRRNAAHLAIDQRRGCAPSSYSLARLLLALFDATLLGHVLLVGQCP